MANSLIKIIDRLFFYVKEPEEEDDYCYQIITFYRLKIHVLFLQTKSGNELTLSGFSIDGPGAGASRNKIYRIKSLYGEFMAKKHNVKKVTIIGGKRTTGANPGRFPGKMVIFDITK